MKLYLKEGAEYNDAEEIVAMGMAGFEPVGEQAGYDFDDAFDAALEILYPTEHIGESQDMIADLQPYGSPERYSEH